MSADFNETPSLGELLLAERQASAAEPVRVPSVGEFMLAERGADTRPQIPVVAMQPPIADAPDPGRLSQSVEIASRRSPETFSQVLRRARELNLPTDVIERNPNEALRILARRGVDVDQLVSTAPETARLLSDPDILSAVRDVKDTFVRQEQLWRPVPREAEPFDFLRENLAGALRPVAGVTSSLGVALRAAQSPDVRRATAPGGPLQFLDPANYFTNIAGPAINNLADFIQPPEERRTFASTLYQGGGQLAATLGLALAFPPLAPLLTVGQAVGQADLSARAQGFDTSTPEGQATVLISGAVQGWLENTGVGAILGRYLPDYAQTGVSKAVADYITRLGVQSGLGRSVVNVGAAATTEAITEAAQQIVQNFSERVGFGSQRGVFEGLTESAGAGGVLGGAFRTAIELALGIRGARARRAGAPRPEAVAETVRSAVNEARSPEAATARNRDASTVRQHALATDGESVLYVSPEPMLRFYQSLPPDGRKAIEDALPQFKQQLDEAVGADTPVAVRAGDFSALMAHQPGAEQLADHVKTNPEADTLAEQQEIETLRLEFKKALEPVKAEIQAQDKQIRNMLREAGLSSEAATAHAVLIGRMRRGIARQVGVTAEDLNQDFVVRRADPEYARQVFSAKRAVMYDGPSQYDPVLDMYFVGRGEATRDVADMAATQPPSSLLAGRQVTRMVNGKERKVSAGKYTAELGRAVNVLQKLEECLGA